MRRFHLEGQTQYRRDLAAADDFDETPRLHRRVTVRAVVDVPFSDGTLAVNSLEPEAFDDGDIELFEEMAVALTEGFTRLRDPEAALEGRRRAEALAEAIQVVATEDDVSTVLQRVCSEAAKLTESRTAALFLFDEQQGALVPHAHVGHTDARYRAQRLPSCTAAAKASDSSADHAPRND